MSLTTAISSPSPSDTQGGNDGSNPSLLVATISLVVVLIALIVLGVILLILIMKKTQKRVIIVKPVENPNYNHLAILEEPQPSNIIKRLSLRLKNRFSIYSSNGGTLTRQSSNTLPRSVSKQPTFTAISATLPSPIKRYYSSGVIERGEINVNDTTNNNSSISTSPDDFPIVAIHKRDDPEIYDVPDGSDHQEDLQPPKPRAYSQICMPVYSDFHSEGYFVLTKEERKMRGSLSGHFTQIDHHYNKLHFFEQCDEFWMPSSTTSGLYTQLSIKKYREITAEQIETQARLGSGNFGAVFKGKWRTEQRLLNVAVKVLSSDSNIIERLKFLQEAAIMGQFCHPNIIRLHGVVTIGEPTMIVLELASKGDLLTYLNKLNPTDNSKDQDPLQRLFVKFAQEIASGMEHLSMKRFIHRDLAARNILLSSDLTCKIGDFGMARDLLDEDYYTTRGGKVPIKWTAPEALLYKKYSSDSDVWSYGILLYEIWSLGKKPFPDKSNSEMVELIPTGICHSPPPGLPKAIYTLMVDCWNPEHSKRPTFEKISSYMSQAESVLLHWSERDLCLSPLVNMLGASLTESIGLYADLQNIYSS
jgi:ephrin-B